jgi:hypothetical protein
MESGPSKEQLENLYKTSRKYFDEMAMEYYAKDRDFYNKNFAPFYSNPLLNATKGKKPVRLVIAVALFTLIMSFAVAMVMFFKHEQTDNFPVKQSEKNVDLIEKKTDKPATSIRDSVDKVSVKTQRMMEEMNQRESEVKENTGKREVRNKPVERQR